jgi:hypothetical protein
MMIYSLVSFNLCFPVLLLWFRAINNNGVLGANTA